jgi:hypothetical protein
VIDELVHGGRTMLEGKCIPGIGGHLVERNYRDFAFRASYRGSYKIRITHDSLYDK